MQPESRRQSTAAGDWRKKISLVDLFLNLPQKPLITLIIVIERYRSIRRFESLGEFSGLRICSPKTEPGGRVQWSHFGGAFQQRQGPFRRSGIEQKCAERMESRTVFRRQAYGLAK